MYFISLQMFRKLKQCEKNILLGIKRLIPSLSSAV